jgi:acyl-CoA thioester hydrolase
MPSFRLFFPIEVRFRDLDGLGHVNNAVYITYFEIARTHYWRELFGTNSYEEYGFLVVRTECDYRSPAHFGETLLVATRVSELRNSSFVVEHEVTERQSGRLVAEGKTVQVCFDPRQKKSIPIPPFVRQTISAFEGF